MKAGKSEQIGVTPFCRPQIGGSEFFVKQLPKKTLTRSSIGEKLNGSLLKGRFDKRLRLDRFLCLSPTPTLPSVPTLPSPSPQFPQENPPPTTNLNMTPNPSPRA